MKPPNAPLWVFVDPAAAHHLRSLVSLLDHATAIRIRADISGRRRQMLHRPVLERDLIPRDVLPGQDLLVLAVRTFDMVPALARRVVSGLDPTRILQRRCRA